VTFRVEVYDFTGSIPYIRGKLISLRYAFVWYKYIISVRMAESPKLSGYRTLCGKSMDSCLWSLLDPLYKGVQGFFHRCKAVKMLLWPVTSFVAEVKNLWVFTATLLIGLHGMLLMHKASLTTKTTFILWMTLYCSF
jgi:hypothetical protein